jgi:CRISPR-associated protein Csx10
LIDRLCCEELMVRAPYLPSCDDRSHVNGGDRVEAFSGFHQGGRSISAPLHLTTRVAINRQRKVAEPKLLYSPLVISESSPKKDTPNKASATAFCASIVINERVREIIESRLHRLTHIGSSASRGFGRVEVTTEPITTDDLSLSRRLTDFNEWARKRWRLWEQTEHERTPPHTPDNGTFFAVLLMADAMLRADGGWTPTMRLEPHMLGEEFQNATLLRCYATPEYRGGWNTAWGLPKDTELVARMSSVYLFHTPRLADDEGLLNALRKLEERGVGERRREGFGQVRVCDEFHREIQNPNAGGENR